ncbi:hypothetical protein E2C01_091177 [Portunus trituberculatus]|uniref:Uncharacterized protein n=1 Tax=Portunus trituberculatus TaxID=210409 RepID=A0A5B7JS28_PORTR|nr:hypothetical protein [Portunus trituberculatus]
MRSACIVGVHVPSNAMNTGWSPSQQGRVRNRVTKVGESEAETKASKGKPQEIVTKASQPTSQVALTI